MGFGPVDDRTWTLGGILLVLVVILLICGGVGVGWLLWR